MGQAVVRLVVELRTGSDDPVAGRVVRDGTSATFIGWTELGQAIVRLTDLDQHHVDGNERKAT